MSNMYHIVEIMVFVLGLSSLILWVRLDAHSRVNVNTYLWMVAALFLPAMVYYIIAVRLRYPRTEPPTNFEYISGSFALSTLIWTIAELYFPTYFPRNTNGAVLTVTVILSLCLLLYVIQTTFRRESSF